MQNPLKRIPFFSIVSSNKLNEELLCINKGKLRKKNSYSHFYIEMLGNFNSNTNIYDEDSLSKILNNSLNSNYFLYI